MFVFKFNFVDFQFVSVLNVLVYKVSVNKSTRQGTPCMIKYRLKRLVNSSTCQL